MIVCIPTHYGSALALVRLLRLVEPSAWSLLLIPGITRDVEKIRAELSASAVTCHVLTGVLQSGLFGLRALSVEKGLSRWLAQIRPHSLVTCSDSGIYSSVFVAAKRNSVSCKVVQWAYLPEHRVDANAHQGSDIRSQIWVALFALVGRRLHFTATLGAGEAEYVGVFNDQVAAALERHSVQREKLSVLGVPEVAAHLSKVVELPQGSRNVVAILTQPFYRKDIQAISEAKQLALYQDLIRRVLDVSNDLEILLRVHPAEDPNVYRAVLGRWPRVTVQDSSADVGAALGRAFCFVSHHSSLNEVFKAARIPQVAVNLVNLPQVDEALRDQGISSDAICRTPEQAAHHVQRLLDQRDSIHQDWLEIQKRVLEIRTGWKEFLEKRHIT